jgi:hypothetical protein
LPTATEIREIVDELNISALRDGTEPENLWAEAADVVREIQHRQEENEEVALAWA